MIIKHIRKLFGALSLSLLFLIVPACQKVSLRPEYARTQKIVKEHMCEDIYFDDREFKEVLAKELSRDEALRIALLNNKFLQASFQELGIAKADLIQAGLLKNPSIAISCSIPKKESHATTNIELEAPIISLTDLFQIPLRKKVFTAHLEMILSRFITQLFDIFIRTGKAFDELLSTKALLKNAHDTWLQTKKLRDDIYDRQQFGFANDLDKNLADVAAENWQVKVTRLTAREKNATLKLAYVLGLDAQYACTLKLAAPVQAIVPPIPSLEMLLKWAQQNHPKIVLGRSKVAYYRDQVSYERSRILKMFDAGVAFTQDFDQNHQGTGPFIALEVPLFDQNQASIARADYGLKKAQKELLDTELSTQSDIMIAHNDLVALTKSIDIYEKVLLNAQQEALTFTITFHKAMQITTPTVLQTIAELYKVHRKYIRLSYKALDARSDLEQAVGKKLSTFTMKEF